jgi:hypothetical protein
VGRIALLLSLACAVLCSVVLTGCRADLGACCADRDAIAAHPVAQPAAPKATFAEQLRSRWVQTSLEPGAVAAQSLEEKSTMNVLRGADNETVLAAQACTMCMQQAKADRMADAIRPFTTWYGDAHCH